MKIPLPKITLPTLDTGGNIFQGAKNVIGGGVDAGKFVARSAYDALPSVPEVHDQVTGVIEGVAGNVRELIDIIQNPHPTIDGKVIQIGTLAWNIVSTGERVTAILVATQVRFFHNLSGGFTTDIKIAQVSLKVGDALINPEENFIPRILQITDAARSVVELSEYLQKLHT